MSGGAGYILSREALRKLVVDGFSSPSNEIQKSCQVKQNTGSEDVNLGRCLEKLNVHFVDSRDFRERHRFLPDRLYSFFQLERNMKFWIWNKTVFPINVVRIECLFRIFIDFNGII